MKRRKRLIALAALVVLVGLWLVYRRPLSVGQLCPELDFQKCIGMKITATLSGGANQSKTTYEYQLSAGDPGFAELLERLKEPAFRRKLRSLLPAWGTPVHLHSAQPNDFQWEILCDFSLLETADGNGHVGDLLRVNDFYGKNLTLSCMADSWDMAPVSEDWRQAVFDLIAQFCPEGGVTRQTN